MTPGAAEAFRRGGIQRFIRLKTAVGGARGQGRFDHGVLAVDNYWIASANRPNNSGELATIPLSGTYPVDSCEAYRHCAAKCVKLARTMDSARDRLIMLEMALVWSRLAEFAAKTAARKQYAELISPTTADGDRAQHVG
jgi:hypothetical protein